MSDFILFFKEGLCHVLDWNAYDHILFIILIAVPYIFRDWKRVIWLITFFTIGHTISLFLSTYDIINFNTRWIEFLIPATIFIAALFNIFNARRTTSNSSFWVIAVSTLFFGIIHGLGFAGYFKEMTYGFESRILPLLEFSLGIEAAQLIITLMVLILGFIFQSLFRFSKKDWVQIISAIVLGLVIPMLNDRWLW